MSIYIHVLQRYKPTYSMYIWVYFQFAYENMTAVGELVMLKYVYMGIFSISIAY